MWKHGTMLRDRRLYAGRTSACGDNSGKLSELPRIVAAISSAIVVACGAERSEGKTAARAEVTRVGDTTIVTTYGEVVPRAADEVELLWRSPELENPVALLHAGTRIVVADRDRVHLLADDGEHLRTVGRAGEGPGEFLYIVWVGRLGQDTIAVHDAVNHRLSFMTRNGDYLGFASMRPPRSYANPLNAKERGGPARGFVAVDGGVISFWRDGVFSDGSRPTRTALVWTDWVSDTATVRRTWDGERWIGEGPIVVPRELFGPRVISAIASDGRVAVGNGTDYCVTIEATNGVPVRKVCRNRTAAPVGDGIRSPDLRRVRSAPRREALEVLVRRQELPRRLPHFDRLFFDEQGWLWVRTLGTELSEVSPYLTHDVPSLVPDYRMWDVYDVGGALVATISLPSNFEPQTATPARIYGFVELSSGEVAIGALALPF
ncbi:MAG: hypothetical protein MJB57_15420 [Gemmatimonadetes bacterium]|nr:hypothetical protein [Gemmatimonadota bacterium]